MVTCSPLSLCGQTLQAALLTCLSQRTQRVSTGMLQCTGGAGCTAPTACQLRIFCCWRAAKTPVGSLGAASSMSSTCGMMLEDASDSSGQLAEQVREALRLRTSSVSSSLALMQRAKASRPCAWV